MSYNTYSSFRMVNRAIYTPLQIPVEDYGNKFSFRHKKLDTGFQPM